MLLDITWYSSCGRGSTGASSTPSLARWERVKASQLVRVTSRPYTRTWHREVFSVPGGDHTHLGADVEVSPVPVLAVSSLQQPSRGHDHDTHTIHNIQYPPGRSCSWAPCAS